MIRKLCMEIPFDPHMPDEYLSHYIRAEKMNMLDKIMDEMYHDRWWAIRFHERWPSQYEKIRATFPPYPLTTYVIECEISEIQSEHFVMPELAMYESWSTHRVAMTAVGELVRRIKRKLRIE